MQLAALIEDIEVSGLAFAIETYGGSGATDMKIAQGDFGEPGRKLRIQHQHL